MKKEKIVKFKQPCLDSIVAAYKCVSQLPSILTLEHCRKCKKEKVEDCSLLLRDVIRAYETIDESLLEAIGLIDSHVAHCIDHGLTIDCGFEEAQ